MATIKELKRMCKSFETSCNGCPFQNEIDGGCLITMLAYDCFPDNADEIVDKWVSEHPVKTYTMDFFEKFPKAPKDPSGCPMPCIRLIHSEFIDKSCLGYTCKDCWNQLIPENK